jgi:hypothetical protein
VITLISSFYRLLTGGPYGKLDRSLAIVGLSSVHLQFIIGLVLYFISPKVIFNPESMSDSFLRFFLVEHAALMLLVVLIITFGYKAVKKAKEDRRKHIRTLLFYLSSLIIIFFSIPWPWKNLGGSWF